ncbi:MAG: hypothetical protein AAF193_03390, partial [Bacteroidota bacterium]
MKRFIFLVSLILQLACLGQTELSSEEVLEDYYILKSALIKAHPSLYDYTTSSEWDSIFQVVEKDVLRTVNSRNDFYKVLVELTDHAHDGHLMVMRPPMDPLPNFFPLHLVVIDEKFYTDVADQGIPLGSEVLSIDGVSSVEIRNRMLKYAPSDGYNTTKKDRQIEREFGILHFYEFGAKASYLVRFKSPSGEQSEALVESASFESIGQRFSQRSSLQGRRTQQPEPHVQLIDSLNTAVLTLNSFHLETEE